MRASIRKILVAVAVVSMVVAAGAHLCMAQPESRDYEGKNITAIDFEGNKMLSSAVLLSKIKSKVGLPYSQKNIAEDIKALYATGFFSNIAVDTAPSGDGVKVKFVLEERRVVESVSFSGNHQILEKQLTQKIKTKPGQMLDMKVLKDDLLAVKQLYEEKGYTTSQVDYKTADGAEAGKIKITITIDEGVRPQIVSISFKGNDHFSRGRLIKLITTRNAWLFNPGFVKEEQIREDVERLTGFYEDNGYLDASVDYTLDYGASKVKAHLTFVISEGKKYLTGDITIKGNKVIDTQSLVAAIKMKKDKTFTSAGMRDDIYNMKQLYFDKGYISCDIAPATLFNQNTQRMDITYTIDEKEKCYLGKIFVKGNTKTKDVVIRREVKLTPGDLFDGNKLRRSKERLYNLGYFEEVDFDIVSTEKEDIKDLLVKVKEAKTGEFSFGGGYSSIDKIIGFVAIEQKNFDLFNFSTFTGAGQDLKLSAEFGSRRRNYNLSFTEPWFLGYPYSFGFDLYSRERLRGEGYAYDIRRTGGDLRFGHEFWEYDRWDLTYRLEKIKLTDIPEESSADLLAEEGENTISTIALQFTRDTRDNIYNPTRGYIVYTRPELAGGVFAGDKDFWKVTSGGSIYFTPIAKNQILELRSEIAFCDAYGDSLKVPIYERLYAGGADTVRGYRERRIGPKDALTRDPIGGNASFIATAEYTVPIVDFIRGAVFYDVGNVWEKVGDFGSDTLRSGVGVGVRIKTPMGPVKVDYGYPINPEPQESKSGRFYFSMTHMF
jgi:outer membrane protein insertion porin family